MFQVYDWKQENNLSSSMWRCDGDISQYLLKCDMAGRKSASYEFYHLNKVIIIRLSLFRICLSAVVHIEELWPH